MTNMILPTEIFTPAETEAWSCRADVLDHFFAYQHFDEGPRHAHSIDLINLDDADVQYYNRVAEQTRIFAFDKKLAQYLYMLPSFKLPASTTTKVDVNQFMKDAEKLVGGKLDHRQALLLHVKLYNMSQEPRRRFYLLGLGESELMLLQKLEQEAASVGQSDVSQPTLKNGHDGTTTRGVGLVVATDGCPSVAELGDELLGRDTVSANVEKCLADRTLTDSVKPV